MDTKIKITEKQIFSNSHDNNLNIINFVNPLEYEIEDFDTLLSNQDIDNVTECLNVNQKRLFQEIVHCL